MFAQQRPASGRSPLPRLVRDGVPEALEREGFRCRSRQLEGRELTNALRVRVQQETQFYLRNPSLAALAELIDLLELLARASGTTQADLRNARAELRGKYGAYGAGTWLESAEPVAATAVNDGVIEAEVLDTEPLPGAGG